MIYATIFLKIIIKLILATIYNKDFVIHTSFFIILFYESNYDV